MKITENTKGFARVATHMRRIHERELCLGTFALTVDATVGATTTLCEKNFNRPRRKKYPQAFWGSFLVLVLVPFLEPSFLFLGAEKKYS